MTLELFFKAPVGLLPVILFLLVLIYLDSYKLVHLRTVLWVIGLGILTAVASYFANGALKPLLAIDMTQYSRYVAPLIEESLKALAMVYLFRSHRIGFLVDAAILGFAVGAGFALAENFYYIELGVGSNVGVWIVRGFGTAIMHGGTTALFTIIAQTLTERTMKINLLRLLPGLGIAIVLHSIFNHFPGTPILVTMGTIVALPAILALAFRQGAKSMHQWLQLDFDADAELIEQINSSQFSDSRIGRYLHELREKFDGPVVVDMLCYLRVYTELAIRAKGVLMAREAGLDLPLDATTREKFDELRYLEKSVGKTGLLAMRPFLLMERKDLWQMNVLQG